MADTEEKPTGPDLTQPFPISSVPRDGMIAGHAFGAAVVLARAGEKWLAVSGKCTHYGAPLADGVLVGEEIRCPWHHARFDLGSGAARCAPALNDLAVYEVEVGKETVRIVRKLSPEEARPPKANRRTPQNVQLEQKPADGPSSVVIVGAGAAGNACAEMLRREGYRGPITMVDPDRDAPYDRPNISKDYLAGNAPEERLPLHPPTFYREQKIELLSGVEARSIDARSRRIKLSDGSEREYGSLLLATGASPIRLNIPGGDSILYLRSLADCHSIQSRITGAKGVIVIGGSFIGLEVAASLRARGLEVTVVAPDKVPLERVMGPELGALVKSVHEKRGVTFKLGRSVTSLEGKTVKLDDGTKLEADFVVAGVGVKPNLELAEQAGLALDKGITVNEFLETSQPGIFAAGDIARWPDPHSNARIRVEHWVVAERQGQTVARNMLGRKEPFDDVPFFWSMHYDTLGINYSGHAERWDATKVDGDLQGLNCAVSFLLGGKRLATATIGRDRQSLEAELAMERENRRQ